MLHDEQMRCFSWPSAVT